jgi:hypothetical protein
MCSATTTEQTLNQYQNRNLGTLRLLRQTNRLRVNSMSQRQTIFQLDNVLIDQEEDEIDNYTPSQDFLSPFKSDGVVTLMREVSGNPRIGIDFERQVTKKIH